MQGSTALDGFRATFWAHSGIGSAPGISRKAHTQAMPDLTSALGRQVRRLLQQPFEQAAQKNSGLRAHICELHAHSLGETLRNRLGLNNAAGNFKKQPEAGAYWPRVVVGRKEQTSRAQGHDGGTCESAPRTRATVMPFGREILSYLRPAASLVIPGSRAGSRQKTGSRLTVLPVAISLGGPRVRRRKPALTIVGSDPYNRSLSQAIWNRL